MRGAAAVALCLTLAASATAEQTFWPARYREGGLPPLPVAAVGGGQVLLELDVDRAGSVRAVAPLRTTPPFAAALLDAVRGWQFAPAEALVQTSGAPNDAPARQTVASKVLLAAVYRAPTVLNTPTLGEPPHDRAVGSAETPQPLTIVEPTHPPLAVNSGLVMFEASIDAAGSVTEAIAIRSDPGFEAAARAALMKWRFRPARYGGAPTAAVAYVIFGFPVPVGAAGGASHH